MKCKIIELSNTDKVTGRAKIKLSLHEIFESSDTYQKNGLSWSEEYTNNNLDSCVGMPIAVSFIDDTKTIPSDHGTYEELENGDISFGTTSDVVGSVNKAYISTISIDGIDKKVLMAEGEIYTERCNNFYTWLKDTIKDEKITTSIEIGKKDPNERIVYDGGYKPLGRIPMEYDYTCIAILYIVAPADDSAVVLEINNEEGEKLEKNKIEDKTFELNAINYYDICSIITRAFNKLMNPECSCWCDDYWIHCLYPTESYAVFTKYNSPGEYWKAEYVITNGSIELKNVVQVEEDWKPKSDSTAVSIDLSSLKKDFESKEEEELNVCKEKELNNNQGGSGDMADGVKNDSTMVEINEKLTTLTEKLSDSDNKIAELNNAIVEANKTIEAQKTELNTVNEELKTLREFKADKDSEAKKSEINSYFEKEISKNGFSDIELNSLKEYVEKIDMDGLKKAESDLCVKKIKELNSVNKSIEVNSNNNDLYMPIHNTENANDDLSDLV